MAESPSVDFNPPRRSTQISRQRTGASRRTTVASAGPKMTFKEKLLSAFKEPARVKKGQEPTTIASIAAIIRASWLNVLLIFIPVSWALNFAVKDQPTVVFVTCFLAIIPLAKLLAWGTEELAIRLGQTLGGLLNATLGNVVELIVGILALRQGQLDVVQSSLVGSMLSNLLLVLGMCFFAGGTRYAEQGFMATAAQLNTSLLVLSVTAILIPAAFQISTNTNTDPDQATDVKKMSRGVAFLLLIIYAGNLIFTLWSHSDMYADAAANESTPYAKRVGPSRREMLREHLHLRHRHSNPEDEKVVVDEKGTEAVPVSEEPLASAGSSHEVDAPVTALNSNESDAERGLRKEPTGVAGATEEEDDDDTEVPQLTPWVAFGLLVSVTVLVAVTAEFLVDSIDGLTSSGHISKTWVGLILLPIVGNAAEHVTAVTVAVKNKLDLSIGVAVGSSIQIALFVIPFLVLLGWIIGQPLTLLFDPFQSVILFLAVLTVAFCINDGRSNWLEGLILMTLYVIIAVAAWFYVPPNGSSY